MRFCFSGVATADTFRQFVGERLTFAKLNFDGIRWLNTEVERAVAPPRGFREARVWNPTHGCALGNRHGIGREKMWLALAAISLACGARI